MFLQQNGVTVANLLNAFIADTDKALDHDKYHTLFFSN